MKKRNGLAALTLSLAVLGIPSFVSAEEIEAFQAEDIVPFQAEEIKPYKGKVMEMDDVQFDPDVEFEQKAEFKEEVRMEHEPGMDHEVELEYEMELEQHQYGASPSITLKLENKQATINGVRKNLDVAPFTIQNRTMVPIRFISESLGATVDWNAEEQQITIQLNGDTMIIWLGKKTAIVNGRTVTLEVPAQLSQNRTVVPLRFVAENLKQKINYNSSTKTITIGEPSSPIEEKTESGSDLSYFFGTFSTRVPGVAYTTPIPGTNYETLHTSVGALSGGIKINADGTYVWNSTWEGKTLKGKWEKTGDAGYPIVLLNGEDGKDWRVGKDPSSDEIFIWDGSIWKNGTRVQ